ncbi:hypothetical protein [Cognatishimia sp. F0-27]|uniref:hypothetical protein n=1 Tax=Cognatishimia sp. F0-27 TaxID=2816855 RepID=UPI001D0C1ADC|nr:hypothetical protein [Cognatishimia sp. F0-27]MCC1494048.1 hypothetical protein [Cognatishimia sp. F0-27]
MRFPRWVCVLGGAVIVGGATAIAQRGTFDSAGAAAGYLLGPVLIGAGIGWVLSKLQGVDPKYAKNKSDKGDTP